MVSRLLQDLRYRKAWGSVGVALLLLVVHLSLTPNPVDAPQIEGFDLGHFSAYFVLMAWWSQLVRRGWPRVAVAAALIGMGIGLEFVQGLTDYRTFDVADMRDNAIGVAAAFVLVLTPLGQALAALERQLGRAPR